MVVVVGSGNECVSGSVSGRLVVVLLVVVVVEVEVVVAVVVQSMEEIHANRLLIHASRIPVKKRLGGESFEK